MLQPLQVDGVNIPLKEGSVVRVAPAGKRAVRKTGDLPLVMHRGTRNTD